MSKCEYCGKEFSNMDKRGRKKLYCCDYCRRQADYKRRKEGTSNKKVYSVRCKQCGVMFETHHKGQMYCNRQCFYASRIRICEMCGKEYKPTCRSRRYCSIACAGKAHKEYSTAEEKKLARNRQESMRRRTDPSFVIRNRMRSLMCNSLRGNKGGKKWEDIVGYSVEELRSHLEKQFTGDMSWKHFLAGEIHIDHKIPVSVFNFESISDIDFKKCWAISNLQPLWAFDNMSKSDRLMKPFQPSLAISI